MANLNINFSEIVAETPILENVAAEYQDIEKQFNCAQSFKQRQTVIHFRVIICADNLAFGAN